MSKNTKKPEDQTILGGWWEHWYLFVIPIVFAALMSLLTQYRASQKSAASQKQDLHVHGQKE